LAILWGFFVAIYVHFKLATNKFIAEITRIVQNELARRH